MNQLEAAHPDLKVDVEAELNYYRSVRDEVVQMTTDTIEYMNQALLENKKVLVEGILHIAHAVLYRYSFLLSFCKQEQMRQCWISTLVRTHM